MAGKGKAGAKGAGRASGGKSVVKQKKWRTISERAGLLMPVGKIHRRMKEANLATIVQKKAAIWMASTLDYLLAEIFDIAGEQCHACKKARITPRHILIAVRQDEEVNQLLAGVCIAEGGVLPKIEPSLKMWQKDWNRIQVNERKKILAEKKRKAAQSDEDDEDGEDVDSD